MMSGSNALARFPETIICMSPHEEESCSIVNLTARNFNSPNDFVLEMAAPIFRLRKDLDPTKYRKANIGNRPNKIPPDDLLDLIEGEEILREDWFSAARRVGVTEGHFNSTVATLRLGGKIVEDRQGMSILYRKSTHFDPELP